MKKMIALAMALAMALSMAACGGSSQPASSGSSSASSGSSSGAASSSASAPAASAPAAAAPAAAPADVLSIQVGHCDTSAEDNSYQVYATIFKDKVEELSGGTITVEIMGDGIIGGERDLMEGMNLGTIDMSIVSNMYTANFAPKFKAFDLPYLFEDYEDAVNLFKDPEVWAVMQDDLMTSNNTVLLSAGVNGFRHTINTIKPIEHVSDFNGMKIRVPETPSLVSTFKAFGANCTTTAWSEAFTAVQQKTCDGLECSTASLYTGHFWEVCKYLSLTKHMWNGLYLMASSSFWGTLSADQQKWISDAALYAADAQVKKVQELEGNMLKEMNDAGCTVNEVDLEEFAAVVGPAYDEYYDQYDGEWLDSVIAKLG